jgi:hypothetical protein
VAAAAPLKCREGESGAAHTARAVIEAGNAIDAEWHGGGTVKTRRAWRTAAAFALALAGLLPPTVHAQATGSIAGFITDQSGAVLPGVTVVATSAATGQIRSAVSGEDGHVSIPLLPPGLYDVKAALTGFTPVVTGIASVSVGDTTRIDMTLSVGGLSDRVTVSAETPIIETAHATLGITIDHQKIVELPLNGRNFTQLGTLIPGVVTPPAALGGGAGDATPGGFGAATSGFSVNGMRTQSNNFLLDGASNNDTFNTGFVMRPPPDAIQEFKIQSHSYSAEFGRNAGSVVNVVTRGGTNVLHGAAWEFNRNDALQARNLFAPANQPKPRLKQNQYGGSAGGPIVKSRVFGFGYYEGIRHQRGATSDVVVLSDAQRNGDFGGTAIRDPQTGLPFPDNQIPRTRINGSAAQLIERFVPHANSGVNHYVVSPETKDNRDSAGTRVDVVLGQRHSLLGRFL